MFKHKSKVNRFSAAADAAVKGNAVYMDNGRDYNLISDYPFRLNFYLKPPPSDITIEEFEEFALDRLQVLRCIENTLIRGKDLKKELSKSLEEYLPLKSNTSRSDALYEERRKDHVSHFVLRMAYCRSEDLRQWFVRQETTLFKFKFQQESIDEKKAFLKNLNLNWKMLNDGEKQSIKKELIVCCRALLRSKSEVATMPVVEQYVNNETFFEVDFEKVPSMVGSRLVYLKGGKAYVPMSEQVNIVMNEYSDYLLKALESTAKLLPRMEEDDRLKPILMNVEKQYMGNTYNSTMNSNYSGSISANEVDLLVKKHAPLCMRSLNENLQKDKHLKYDGRLQFGLFIKGIGLSVEEALIFWRKSFSNITDDKFQKEYAYNVRYNYGLEGRRVNYNPYSCSKIISGAAPGTGEHHGCPFRHGSEKGLEAQLYRDGIGKTQVSEILSLVHNKHYQVACTRHFEVTHTESKEKIDSIEHPNQYYELSKKLAENEEQNKPNTEEAMEID